MLEAVVEILGELALQVVAEGVLEVGVRGGSRLLSWLSKPVVTVLGFALGGAALGGLSLLVVPQHLIGTAEMRLASLLLTPLLVGGALVGLSLLRRRRYGLVARFASGLALSLCFGLVRFLWAG